MHTLATGPSFALAVIGGGGMSDLEKRLDLGTRTLRTWNTRPPPPSARRTAPLPESVVTRPAHWSCRVHVEHCADAARNSLWQRLHRGNINGPMPLSNCWVSISAFAGLQSFHSSAHALSGRREIKPRRAAYPNP